MAKNAYIIQEHERNGFTMDTQVYSSKERAIKAFTEKVNRCIAYDYFKDADDTEYFEAFKKLKGWNECSGWPCCSKNQPSLLSSVMRPKKKRVDMYTFNSQKNVRENTTLWNQ